MVGHKTCPRAWYTVLAKEADLLSEETCAKKQSKQKKTNLEHHTRRQGNKFTKQLKHWLGSEFLDGWENDEQGRFNDGIKGSPGRTYPLVPLHRALFRSFIHLLGDRDQDGWLVQ